MRRYLIAGNWKMHGSKASVKDLTETVISLTFNYPNVDMVVLPSYVHLTQVHHLITNSYISIGAQNLYLGNEGAFTGEVSGPMLADIGCSYVLVGHSERRQYFHETNELVAKKFKVAITANLTPILCVGETLDERNQGKTEEVITAQIHAVLKEIDISAFKSAVIAYEPVWAIGTGQTATPVQAQEVHEFIRKLLHKNNVDIASTIRILYGGSMKPENAGDLLAMSDVDGGLIGGASLKAESFAQICQTANHLASMSGHKACRIG